MSLHLHYVDSIAPHLSEIFDPLIKRHFDFKLRDSFLIIVPDLETRRDVEDFLLKDERLQGILIGKSVLTFQELIKKVLEEHPKYRNIANSYLEKKAIRIALSKTGSLKYQNLDTIKQYLYEYKRSYHLNLLSGGKKKNFNIDKIFCEYQRVLENKLKCWSEESAFEELCLLIQNGRSLAFKAIQDIYFLGFDYPSGYLLKFLESLARGPSKLNSYCFFPRPETLLDNSDFLAPALNRLETLAEKKVYHNRLPTPTLKIASFLTPLHESQSLWKSLGEAQKKPIFFFPRNSWTFPYFEILVRKAMGQKESFPYFDNVPGTDIFDIFENLKEKPPEGPITLAALIKLLIPPLQKLREALALSNSFSALKALDLSFSTLQKCLMAENNFVQKYSYEEWIRELKDYLLESGQNSFSGIEKVITLRSIERHGLKYQPTVSIFNFNEDLYPPPLTHYLTMSPADDPLYYLEKKLAYIQCLNMAGQTVSLSFVNHNMTGRSSGPSPYLDKKDINQATEGTQEFYLMNSRNHPHFLENIRQEIARGNEEPFGIYQGNLSELNLKKSILNKLKKRPLSARYIDEFSICPWKFFASWHLGLEEVYEERLDMEPKWRGSVLHRLLEMTYKKLINQYFSKDKIPTPDFIANLIQNSSQELQSEIYSSPEAERVPRVVLEDEIERILEQVKGLLEIELQKWSESEKKLFPKYLEWRFGKNASTSLIFDLDKDLKVPFTGAIDRIDLSKDGDFLIIDYKSSGSETLGRNIRNIASFQLFIYILAVKKLLLKKGAEVGGLYWDLKKQKINQGLAVKSKYSEYTNQKLRSTSFLSEEKYHELKENLEKGLKHNLRQILLGNYQLKPSDCQGARCQYHEICRYENQPQ